MLVNDWSARDIQRYEYEPLGPFLGKSFAPSMSAWITPLHALRFTRVAPREQEPVPAAYVRARRTPHIARRTPCTARRPALGARDGPDRQ